MADTATDIARLTADAQANQQTVAQVVTLVGDLKNQVGTLQAGDVLTADQKAALEAALAQIEGTTQQAQGALPQTAPPAGDGSGGASPAGDGSGGASGQTA